MEELVYHQLWVNISVLLYIQVTCIFPVCEKYKENNTNIISGILIKNTLTLIALINLTQSVALILNLVHRSASHLI